MTLQRTPALPAVDTSYHYPPELFQLLVDAIPLLCRSKQDVLVFFRGAGVADQLLADLAARVRVDRASVNKYEIVRTVLSRLNEGGDSQLRERREVVKRVVGYEDFSTCWSSSDALKAKGLVAEIQRVVNVKDSFTRMNHERQAEHDQNRKEKSAAIEARAERNRLREEIKRDFYRLFAEADAVLRGKALERVLNRLFKASGVLVREAFTLRISGSGVVEQIDGVFELDGHFYLVEVKWWATPLGPAELAQHLVRVYGRADTRGFFISYTDYTAGAIDACRTALHQRVVTLSRLREFVGLLEREEELSSSLPGLLRAKVRSAELDRNPLVEPLGMP